MTIVITGTSSGIGFALSQHYLKQGYKVIGIGRQNIIQHPNFHFEKIDLAEKISFDFLDKYLVDTTEVLLINNAGTVGNNERISQQKESDIVTTMSINTIAPMQLTQKVLQRVPIKSKLSIVNISSGAGRRPVSGWASYCASKAALDLFSQTIYLEEKGLNRNIRVYSVAPGVVDTPMQGKIRTANPEHFPIVRNFIEYKEKNELYSVDTVVQKLTKLLALPYDEKIIYSLRDIKL